MISVIIPAWNAETTLAATLSALVPAVVEGIVREVVIVDGGSTDATRAIADATGARLVESTRGRGSQLRAGGDTARQAWFLFLHADTVLSADWFGEALALVEKVESGDRAQSAAAFRFQLSDTGLLPRLVEWGVGVRCLVFRMPYGDQGLLISRKLYDEVGGYKAMPLFEDVDIVRRLGRRRIAMLRAGASTSAVRYRRGGYIRRVLRNWWCVLLYCAGVPAERLEKIYNA